MGLPRKKYNKKIADEILQRLSEGESLLKICKDKHMPCRQVIHKWLLDVENHIFAANYAQARRLQAEYLVDEIIHIADLDKEDYYWSDRNDTMMVDYKNVHRARLMVDTRKWIAAKVYPKVYGDRSSQDVTLRGDVNNPLQIAVEQKNAIVEEMLVKLRDIVNKQENNGE